MLRIRKASRKMIAAFFLLLFSIQCFYPAAAYALTSGPAQPEMQKFQPAGVSDMVDLFTGDFKYEIPLMDVGGYPLNLSYHSGSGIEEEASWVGFGWTLNPGAINRSMRGLPDDFDGTGTAYPNDVPDVVQTVNHRKPFTKVGAQLTIKPTAEGWEFGQPSFHLNVYKDNYYGIGGGISLGLNYSIAKCDATSLTADLNVSSDPRQGVSVEPSMSLSQQYDDDREINEVGLSGGFKYNTRAGLEQVNLGTSFSLNNTTWDEGYKTSQTEFNFNGASFVKQFGHTYVPTLGMNSASSNGSFSVDLGPMVTGAYVGVGGEGYLYQQSFPDADKIINIPAFGYMNYLKGKDNSNAILDFNREKDGAFMHGVPAIAIPVSTEDYFEASSQFGSQQFRPYFNGNYTIFDRTFSNKAITLAGGITLGAGDIIQFGGRLEGNTGSSVTRKWTQDNGDGYLSIAELPNATGTTLEAPEMMYFKKTGEQTAMDAQFYPKIDNDVTVRASIEDCGPITAGLSCPLFKTASGIYTNGAIQRNTRDLRTQTFSYLTAAQASQYGLDKMIPGGQQPTASNPTGAISRVGPFNTDPIQFVRKPHHISEITVTDKDGKRMVYGIPVYNTLQKEVSFSQSQPLDQLPPTPFVRVTQTYESALHAARRTGLLGYRPNLDNSIANTNGRDNIYSSKTLPPYATSFLLTGILSPDYVDLTGDGITDDDLGTAVKFSYQRTPLSYNWRAPYGANMANYNEGLLSDPKDDKASYVYGQKELWYLDTVSSKTMTAIFFTSPRADGLGVVDENGALNNSSRLMKLDSIRLFSKADLLKNGANAIPIKVAHFVYDYSLCPFVPNNAGDVVSASTDPRNPLNLINLNANQGKLTLRQVYFTFGSSSRGETNPYIFNYDMRLIRDGSIANLPLPSETVNTVDGVRALNFQDPAEQSDAYVPRDVDRWGTYKQSFYNRNQLNGNFLNNSEYPYTLQATDNGSFLERQLTDRFASKWQLNSITTPTGGVITVQYESKDYSYVQDQKAMEMVPLAGVGNAGQNFGMIGSSLLFVKVPMSCSSISDFQKFYLTGSDGQLANNLFYNIYTSVDSRGHYEYVHGYAEIDPNGKYMMTDSHTFGIPVLPVNSYNPVSKEAWQMLQTDLPQYAYDNYDNSSSNGFGSDAKAAVRSIIQSFADLRELWQSYDITASSKGFADSVDLTKSFIRLNYPVGINDSLNNALPSPTYGKLGGGARVKSIQISDQWPQMTGVTGAKGASYGISYDYTMTDDNGNKISSGVASYEPEMGNEENPFHQPVNYAERVQWGEDRYHYVEKPFGESYFPAPNVGYSQVKVTNYGADNATGAQSSYTGYTINQFYTARDFPTQVDYLPLQDKGAEVDLSLMLFVSYFSSTQPASQGFKIELNDMHGKQKSVQNFDNSGTLVSSTQYIYSVNDNNAQQKTLNNTVLAENPDGSIPASGVLLGTDAELVTDVRESNSSTYGLSVAAYGGDEGFLIPFGSFTANANADIRDFKSISMVKIIHQYGILKQVVTTQNGSSLTATNLLWDAQTGDVLLTQNQNEYNDFTYALHYPAYQAYDGMSGAYKNIGAVLTGFTTNSTGLVTSNQYIGYLAAGDELCDFDAKSGAKAWIIKGQDGLPRLIDANGNFVVANGDYIITRSGRRNQLSASAGTVVSTVNPLVLSGGNYTLQPTVDKNVLDAKMITYKEYWAMPVPDIGSSPASFSNGSGHVDFSTMAILNDNPWWTTSHTLFGECPNSSSPSAFGIFSHVVPFNNLLVTRGYARFFLSSVPPSQVQSVKLSLYPASGIESNPISGLNNACYIKRVTQQLSCNDTWDSPPPTTDFGKISLPAGLSITNPPYVIDITDMYNDWVRKQDDPNYFEIALMFQDETILQNRQMTFYPPTSSIDIGQPLSTDAQITVYYYSSAACTDPLNQPINPYYQDIKGVWRPDTNYVYLVDRVQVPGAPGQNGGTNIRTSGYYGTFNPFWNINTTTSNTQPFVSLQDASGSDPNWVWTDQPIYFDQKGNEVENTDALNHHPDVVNNGQTTIYGRYGSALYGCDLSVPTAVASNARHNEIAFDGFEDYNFNLENVNPAPCPIPRQLDFNLTNNNGQFCNGNSCIVPGVAHSGNYSLQVNGSINIARPFGNAYAPVDSPYTFDASGRYILASNEQAAGFAPVSGKSYLLSLWVNDNTPDQATIQGLTINVNGTDKLSGLQWPIVEGWKKVDLQMQASDFSNLTISGSGQYIDDIRILPFDGELKSYVYDDNSMRLTAELDENNFATFYEYDDEGTPIRVKKETERGVMTIKENRQALIQQPAVANNTPITTTTTYAAPMQTLNGRTAIGYPVGVFNVQGNLLGNAPNQSAFISLWNADSADAQVGTLAAGPDSLHFAITLQSGQSVPAITGSRYYQVDVTANKFDGARNFNATYIDFGDGTGMYMGKNQADSPAVQAPNTIDSTYIYPTEISSINSTPYKQLYVVHYYPDSSTRTVTFYHNDGTETSDLDNAILPATTLVSAANLRGNLPQNTTGIGGSSYSQASMTNLAGILNWNSISSVDTFILNDGDLVNFVKNISYPQDFLASDSGLSYIQIQGAGDPNFFISRIKSNWNTYFTHLRFLQLSDDHWNREDLSGLPNLTEVVINNGQDIPNAPLIPSSAIDNIINQIASGSGRTVYYGVISLGGCQSRTSASDAAVAQLDGMGWDVVVNGVSQ